MFFGGLDHLKNVKFEPRKLVFPLVVRDLSFRFVQSEVRFDAVLPRSNQNNALLCPEIFWVAIERRKMQVWIARGTPALPLSRRLAAKSTNRLAKPRTPVPLSLSCRD
jgi:hypothetical protein